MIPVDKNKKPLIAWREYQKRLPTSSEVEDWKIRFGRKIAGWAMPTGEASGLIALDFDGPEGLATLDDLDLKPNVKTPSGAAHVWIEYQGEHVKTGQFDNRWPGMELKGDGGYVIIEGKGVLSAHNGSEPVEGDYTLLTQTPTKAEELPDELHDFIFGGGLDSMVRAAVEQAINGRNNAGFELACQLRDYGLTKAEALEFVYQKFYPRAPRGNHAFTKNELRNSVNSAYSRQKNKAESVIDLINKTDIELWHTPTFEPYATMSGENFPVGSMRMREAVERLYFNKEKKPLDKKNLEEAISTLKALANFEGACYNVSLRIAMYEGDIYAFEG